MIWQAGDMLKLLAGDWSIERCITGAQEGIFAGTARFIWSGAPRLDYSESGILTLPNGYQSDAYRKYVYLPLPDGFTIHFTEEPLRLFQQVQLTTSGEGLSGSASHDCPPDMYNSRYDFRPDGSYEVTHEVSGPRKAYRLHSHYSRKTP